LLLYDFLLNAIIFLIIFNAGRIASWFKTRRWAEGSPAFTVLLPLGLALLLTAVDGTRLNFAYRLALFLLGALGLYWLAAQVSRRRRW
jgi:hypothetical protein